LGNETEALLNHGLYFFQDHLFCDQVHAGMVAAVTFFISKNGARPAIEGYLDNVSGILLPSVKSGEGMRGAPDAHYRHTEDAGEVHVGRVHAKHHGQVTYYGQFLGEGHFTRQAQG
jgi:hypothetical protein